MNAFEGALVLFLTMAAASGMAVGVIALLESLAGKLPEQPDYVEEEDE